MIIEVASSSQAEYTGTYAEKPEPLPTTGWILTNGNTRDLYYSRTITSSGISTPGGMSYLYNVGYTGGVSDQVEHTLLRAPVYIDTTMSNGSLTYDIEVYKIDAAYSQGQTSGTIGGLTKTLLVSQNMVIDNDLTSGKRSLETGTAANTIIPTSFSKGGSAFMMDDIEGSYGVLFQFKNFSANIAAGVPYLNLSAKIGNLGRGGYPSNNDGIWF